MENKTVENPSITPPLNSAPINQTPISNQTKTSLVFPIILTALLSAVIFGVGGFYFGTKTSYSEKNIIYTQIQPTPTAAPQINIVSPTPVSQQAVIPSDWNYKTNNECGVKFAIPPKVAPYLGSDGRFWDFPRGNSYPHLLSKIALANQEYKQASAMYATASEASGNIAQAVVVSCLPNKNQYANNAQLISFLNVELKKYNSSTDEKGMQSSIYTIVKNTSTQRWGKDVVDLIVEEDASNVSYTMFVTPEYVYEIREFGGLEDSSVKNTAKQIFENLVFNSVRN